MIVNLTPEQRDAISAELAAGRKIDAIRLLREATGLGLKEAKDAVENFDQLTDPTSRGVRQFPDSAHDLTSEQVEDITLALANGSKIQAIKIYRNATGKDLKDSKAFIDALIPQLKQQDPERFAHADEGLSVGCGAKVLMILTLGGLGLWAVRMLT